MSTRRSMLFRWGLILTLPFQLLAVEAQSACQGASDQPDSSASSVSTPEFEFTFVPLVGSSLNLEGHALNVEPAAYRVAVFIYVFGWWTKPLLSEPLTRIQNDGAWACDITTGGVDECATQIAAFLVPANFSPPLLTGQSQLPATLDLNAVARQVVRRGALARELRFSGYDWVVKSTGNCQWGPGPNRFSDSTNNVWVDARGRLHLRLTHRNDRWECAEVSLRQSFGYGTYRLYLDSAVHDFDPNVVFALFTWSDDPAHAHREIDIEFSKWSAVDNPNNAQFVVQPFTVPRHLLAFRQPADVAVSTHSVTWEPSHIFFKSVRGDDPSTTVQSNLIRQWTFTRGSDIPPPGDETARINLWLFNGVPPADGQEVEVVVRKFEFLPARPQIQIVETNGGIVLSWPAVFREFAPEHASAATGTWSRLAVDPAMTGEALEIRVPAEGTNSFFRLRN